MSSKESEPSSKPGGLQAMLARLWGMADSLRKEEGTTPEAATPAPKPAPISETAPEASMASEPAAEQPANIPQAIPLSDPDSFVLSPAKPSPGDSPTEIFDVVKAAKPQACPHCQSPRNGALTYCENCGWIFPLTKETPALPTAPPAAAGPVRLKNRFELQDLMSEHGGVSRFKGLDYGTGRPQAVPVLILRSASPPPMEAVVPVSETPPEPTNPGDDGEILPGFEEPQLLAFPMAEAVVEPSGKSLNWERDLLTRAAHPVLPAAVDCFSKDNWDYLVEEMPAGQSFWEAWDDPAATAERRYGWLKQLAEALRTLHRNGAILETLRPDLLVVNDAGQVQLTDLAELLPLPVPADAPVRGTLYTAPELTASREKVDARANLYSFGALLYALFIGRELSETDFERNGTPKPFIPRFPDIHPLFGRLISKTFCRNVDARFPSDEAVKEDPTGFTELMRVLEVCGQTLDNARFEIASWTTTGMVRTGNEDAFALIHAVESRQDDMGESALILLADGMGGYEAGEVAAALAIQALRKNLLQQKPLAALAGASPFGDDFHKHGPSELHSTDVEALKKLILAALKDANKQVHTASRTGVGRRGMGCTAEVVFINGKNVIVGHVGDSRVYHLHEGKMIQVTRDQTLVNRLVELGTLTPEEAEDHPRRSELQQAVGGHPDVDPALYHSPLKPGDWVVVCSDGISNHITGEELKQMLQSEATSAEMAARRLVNFVNIKGATDNATVVVVRAT